jgi:protease I
MGKLDGKKVAILVADGFEQVEMTKPREALEMEGARTVLVSPKKDKVQGFNHFDKGDSFPVDMALDKARPEDFDALVLPGGAHNPDILRTEPKAVEFASSFFEAGKPVAAICHGPWLLVEAGVVKGRTLTSWPSIQTDIKNAGGTWVDKEVVVDQGLVSSRKPDDIPAFNAKMIEEISEGIHQGQRRSV